MYGAGVRLLLVFLTQASLHTILTAAVLSVMYYHLQVFVHKIFAFFMLFFWKTWDFTGFLSLYDDVYVQIDINDLKHLLHQILWFYE